MSDIEWNGGDCPVWPLTTVFVTFRNGSTSQKAAKNYFWSHNGGGGDIVSYRVIEWPADEAPSQAAKERKSC